MATLNLKNIPEDLIAKIPQLATQHHRTIEEQVISLLQKALETQPTQFGSMFVRDCIIPA
ncbi:MAG: hypothetical protein SAL07_22270 [Oscillatoria sp. PMC 1051.18]|nr:hypothetical protein [Oscillatoria sp. PMC 1050.18]MEC5032636.1 hypothetical protein [Oscillatoria sp. PMC 1051.18]